MTPPGRRALGLLLLSLVPTVVALGAGCSSSDSKGTSGSSNGGGGAAASLGGTPGVAGSTVMGGTGGAATGAPTVVNPVIAVEAPRVNPAPACTSGAAVDGGSLVGKWAYREKLSMNVLAPGFASEFHTVVTSTLLLVARQKGDRLEFDATSCARDAKSDNPTVNTVVPAAVAASIPPYTFGGAYAAEAGGKVLRFDRVYQAEAVHLTNFRDDALPTSLTDPRVFDQDQDGKPAVTIKLTGIVQGEVYNVQRQWVEAVGVAVSASRIEGTVAFDVEQPTLGSDPAIIKDMTGKQRPNPTQCDSGFVMAKLDDAATCASLLAQAATLFGN